MRGSGRSVPEPRWPDEAAGYWLEVLQVGRALEHAFEHAKMNYQTLGNNVPQLHTHIVPGPPLDPAPNEPLPWSCLDTGRQDESELAAAAERLKAALT